MKTFTRDSTIRMKFNFHDAQGNTVNPVSANVSISYVPIGGGESTTVTYPLIQVANDWLYEWDSAVASACVVFAHAQTADGPPTSSVDVEFRLKANRANRELAGDF